MVDVDTIDRRGDQTAASRFIWKLHATAHEFGLPLYVEQSGRKGFHGWLFFAEPAAPALARDLCRQLVARAPLERSQIAVEIFPRDDAAGPGTPQDLIKLPWGVHQATENRCMILRPHAEDALLLPDFLARCRTIPIEHARNALQRLTGEQADGRGPEPPEPLAPLVRGCELIARLVAKPSRTGNLRHAERLILLFTVGTQGDCGRQYLHQVIAQCDNYNPSITQRYIDTLEDDRPPLSCKKLREWLSETETDLRCQCDQTESACGYPTPMAFLPSAGADVAPSKPVRRRRRQEDNSNGPAPEQLADEERLWQEMREDMAGDG